MLDNVSKWSLRKALLKLLAKLSETSLGPWLPQSLWPRFTFLDLEYCPYRKILTEIALLDSPGLLADGAPRSLCKADGLQIEEVQKFLDSELSPVAWLVGHNIRRFL